MIRAEPLAANPIASRLFAPIVRDWERPMELLRILVESLILVTAALVFSRWLAPEDPFGSDAQFPWIWIVPVLLALRYGTIDGVLAVALVLGAWLLPEPWGMTGGLDEPLFPQAYFLGGLVLVLVAGQFADVWNGRLSRVRSANAYLEERLTSLTRAHYLIRLSHQRLEQELLVRPVVLSDLLTELRPKTPEDSGRLSNADNLMRMLVSSCELESAGLYCITDGELGDAPVATVGEPFQLSQDDPLLKMALDEKQCVHVRAEEATIYHSSYLVCAPIRASSGDLLGVLVVRTMPFFSLNEENLQLITVLLGFYADGLLKSRATHPIHTLRPNTPPDFALELVRMKRLYDSSLIDSTIVGFSFPIVNNGQAHIEHLRRIRRGNDIAWELETTKSHVLIFMMPMAGLAAVEGMIVRMDKAMMEQFDLSLADAKITVHTAGISAAECEWTLDDFLNRCGVEQQINFAVSV